MGDKSPAAAFAAHKKVSSGFLSSPADRREFLVDLFEKAVAAADPEEAIRNVLPSRPSGRTIVVGAGKASSQMAAALERLWNGPLEGVVVTRYGYASRCSNIKVIEAAHPVPDEAGLRASRQLLKAVQGLAENDLVIALISGGGSALLPSPIGEMSLDDEIRINQSLLASGAPISAMNAVRKHLSSIKGGRLALAAHPAKVVSLVISDIPGDVPSAVASGPTIADTTSRADALAAISAYGIELPAIAMDYLHNHTSGAPRPDDRRFARNEVHLVASARVSLEAALNKAVQSGIDARVLSDAIEGEARDVGSVHAAIAKEIALRDRPFTKPVLLLSGGETTVTVKKPGRGGRNTEFLAGFAIGIAGVEGITALAADTDGIDGTESNAGAFCDGLTTSRLIRAGFDPRALLAENRTWDGFNAIDDLFSPGPTGTNVNDFRAVLIQ